MHKVELHSVVSLCDEFIRWAQKYWADGIKQADGAADNAARRQVLLDSCYLLRIAALVMHPVVPGGCEKICARLGFDSRRFFSWSGDLDGLDELCTAAEVAAGSHEVKPLPPRFDFFEKHSSQFK